MNAYTIMVAAGWESGGLLKNFLYWVGGDFYNSTRVGLSGSTNFANAAVRIPKSGTIKYFSVAVRNPGFATAETVSHFVRINDVTDVAQIDLTYDTGEAIGSNIVVNQAVLQGDYIAVKVVTPNWGTLPDGVRWRCEVGIQF